MAATRCPTCGSDQTQHVGYDLKCLSCGATSPLHDKPWEQPPNPVPDPSGAKGMNTTQTFGR